MIDQAAKSESHLLFTAPMPAAKERRREEGHTTLGGGPLSIPPGDPLTNGDKANTRRAIDERFEHEIADRHRGDRAKSGWMDG